MSSLRSQLLKEMSSIVSKGVKKGVKPLDDASGMEFTIQDAVTEHSIAHQDEETLEILQGQCQGFYPGKNTKVPKA